MIPRPGATRLAAAVATLSVLLCLLCGGDLAFAKNTRHKPAAPAKADASARKDDGTNAPGETRLPAGKFGTVTVYIPEGTPQSVAIFLSGDGGWQLGVINMARALTDMGAVVVGVDIRQYLGALGKAAAVPDAKCQLIAGDFENLSHRVQKEIGMLQYHVPVLVGYSSGATVVYAALVQSPPGTFAGAMSLGFCSDQDFAGATLCPGAGLHYSPGKKNTLIFDPARTLKQPWIAFQGQIDQVCNPQAVDDFAAQTPLAQVVKLPKVGHGFSVERNWMPQFRDAYRSLTEHADSSDRPAEVSTDISDLPVNEVHAASSTPTGPNQANPAQPPAGPVSPGNANAGNPPPTNSNVFALMLTGDGGWAGLDQELAARLAANGVPTVGLNSLKYFWTERTAEQAAADVARIMRHYLSAWNKQHVLLVGYSFGADVLPFVINRLPPDLRSRVATVNLLGLDSNASFEVTISDWIGTDSGGPPTRPELTRLSNVRVLCVYGEGEKDSICPDLNVSTVTRAQVGKGHHFSGEYGALADRILAFATASGTAPN